LPVSLRQFAAVSVSRSPLLLARACIAAEFQTTNVVEEGRPSLQAAPDILLNEERQAGDAAASCIRHDRRRLLRPSVIPDDAISPRAPFPGARHPRACPVEKFNNAVEKAEKEGTRKRKGKIDVTPVPRGK